MYLDALDISTTRPTKKFAHQYLSPFLIMQLVSTHAYQLKLPHLMSCIHPVFHIIKLMLVLPDPIIGHHMKPPPPPEIIRGEERYKVEEVINSRFWHRKLQYLVKWKGYGHKENLWLSEGDIDAPELIAEFYETHPNAPKCINTLTFGCMGF